MVQRTLGQFFFPMRIQSHGANTAIPFSTPLRLLGTRLDTNKQNKARFPGNDNGMTAALPRTERPARVCSRRCRSKPQDLLEILRVTAMRFNAIGQRFVQEPLQRGKTRRRESPELLQAPGQSGDSLDEIELTQRCERPRVCFRYARTVLCSFTKGRLLLR